MNRVILHIDMDAFYASVEQVDHPSLKGKPVIVGGSSNRGVVCAASYEARKFGVRSAMPIFQAKQKCPNGIYMPVRMARYQEISKRVMNILEEFSPLVEQVSVDEAYLDISGIGRLLGSPTKTGLQIKQSIRESTSLTCSIGIAPNKFLAKIASDLEKPDGLTLIEPKEVLPFIATLPIKKVPGVGEKTMGRLRGLGIHMLGDVQKVEGSLLLERTGKFGRRLLDLSKGIDESAVVPYSEPKSISSEETLAKNTDDMDVLKKVLLMQSELVGRRARAKGLMGMTVTLKLKRADFRQMTRSVTLEEPTSSSNTIYEHIVKLLKDVKSMKFRLVGVGLTNLMSAEESLKQLNLFQRAATTKTSWAEAEKAMDAIKERFGGDAIKRGGLFNDPDTE
ncbi:MAG: DNA polymerase IV [Deltaproteobacteria bacterium]|nr:DNA polymerase IV [Deltaproteobacteria bacterium]